MGASNRVVFKLLLTATMTHASHTYRSLPTNDEEPKPLVIATITSADQSVNRGEQFISDSHGQIARRSRSFIAWLGFIFLYTTFWASKNFVWKGCRGSLGYRLGFGMHKNISNLSIPSDFYQLPSGDKIPAVALGMLK